MSAPVAPSDAEKAVDKIWLLATGKVTGDHLGAAVTELAELFRSVKYSVLVSSGVHGLVTDYWVGKSMTGKSDELQFSRSKTDKDAKPIPLALVVPMVSASELYIVPKLHLNSIMFKPSQYQVLDLAHAPASGENCVLLTSQLSGCTFAIACVKTIMYMGHAQPKSDVKDAKDGVELGETLSKTGKAIFENVPEETVESVFLIRKANSFEVEETGIKYSGTSYVNVIGLVCNHKLYLVVAICSRTTGTAVVEHVLLVTQDNTHKWIATHIR